MSQTRPPLVRHFHVQQGADWSSGTLTAYDPRPSASDGTALDLAGATLRGEVRDAPHGARYFELTLTPVVAASGTFTASLTGTQTSQSSAWVRGALHFDIEVETAGGAEHKLYTGTLRVIPEITIEAT